jgi:hypothetical protein
MLLKMEPRELGRADGPALDPGPRIPQKPPKAKLLLQGGRFHGRIVDLPVDYQTDIREYFEKHFPGHSPRYRVKDKVTGDVECYHIIPGGGSMDIAQVMDCRDFDRDPIPGRELGGRLPPAIKNEILID